MLVLALGLAQKCVWVKLFNGIQTLMFVVWFFFMFPSTNFYKKKLDLDMFFLFLFCFCLTILTFHADSSTLKFAFLFVVVAILQI